MFWLSPLAINCLFNLFFLIRYRLLQRWYVICLTWVRKSPPKSNCVFSPYWGHHTNTACKLPGNGQRRSRSSRWGRMCRTEIRHGSWWRKRARRPQNSNFPAAREVARPAAALAHRPDHVMRGHVTRPISVLKLAVGFWTQKGKDEDAGRKEEACTSWNGDNIGRLGCWSGYLESCGFVVKSGSIHFWQLPTAQQEVKTVPEFNSCCWEVALWQLRNL